MRQDRHRELQVRHRPGEGPHLVQRGAVGDDAVAAHHAVGRLEPVDAAVGSRLTDGTARVAAQRAGDVGRRDGRCAAARAAPRNVRHVPGVLRGAEGGIAAGVPHGELVHVGLAQQDRSRPLQEGPDRRVVRRAPIAQNLAGGRGPHALRAEVVLQHDGNAAQWADVLPARDPGVDLRCPPAALLLRQRDEGRKLRLAGNGTGKTGVKELQRGKLLRADALGGVPQVQLKELHDQSSIMRGTLK